MIEEDTKLWPPIASSRAALRALAPAWRDPLRGGASFIALQHRRGGGHRGVRLSRPHYGIVLKPPLTRSMAESNCPMKGNHCTA